MDASYWCPKLGNIGCDIYLVRKVEVNENVHESSSVQQTEHIAHDLSQPLVGGEVIALEGDLGAGKTQFVRGLVRGLGGDPKVFHLDAYRVGGADDFEAIGFSELLEQGGVVVVEWSSRVAELLPANRINVQIEANGETTRRISISQK